MRSSFGIRMGAAAVAAAALSTVVALAASVSGPARLTATSATALSPATSGPRSAIPQKRPLPPLPPMPKSGGHVRRILSATGACIQFSFNNNCSASGNANENGVAGQTITWQASNLPAAGTKYTDFVVTPNSGIPTPLQSFTARNGPTETQANLANGVYVFAALNTVANTWDAITYFLVGAPVSIDTFNTGSLSTSTQTFTTDTSGQTTVFINTTGLAPQHNYAIGIEDQLTGKCVFTAPASAQTTPPTSLCNLAANAVSGTNATGAGTLTGNWNVQLASAPALPQGGTFMATVYDQTAGTRVASRQFSVIDGRASASTARVNLQFHNSGGTTSTTTSATRIAFNGTASTVNDPNQQFMLLNFGASGLPANSFDTYTLVVSDASGNVAQSFQSNETFGTTTITPSSNEWSFPFESIPFEQAFPGSAWTATIYDATTKRLAAEQSFQILGYSASVLFNNPPSASIVIPTANGSVTTGITFTNTADATFGPNNGDPISQFVATTATSNNQFSSVTFTLPNGTTCGPGKAGNCVATVSDTNGNAWTATLSCGAACAVPQFTLTLTPVNASTPLVPGSSITVPGLTFTGPACAGTGGCSMSTSLTPTDMIPGLSSAGNNVVNPITFTAGTAALSATAAVALVGYYDAGGAFHAAQSGGYTPRFNQSMLAANQPFTGATGKVVFSYTVNNTSTSQINIFDLALPAGIAASSMAIDPHTPNGAFITNNGFCDGVTRPTVCVQPNQPIGARTSQTFDFVVAPPASSFSYTDVVGTIIQSSANGFAPFPVTIAPASANVQTFVGSPAKVDSTALGAYSLNGGLMLGALSPGSVGTSTTNNLTFNFRNTQLGADPFPDDIDAVIVQIPNQSFVTVPTTCSGITVATSGWSCLTATAGPGQPTTYVFGECPQQANPFPIVPGPPPSLGSNALTVCPFALPNEPFSFAPSGALSVTIPAIAGTTQTPAGAPITISSWGHGATTDAWTTPVTSALAVSAAAAAGVGFSSISASSGALTPVIGGTQPQIVGNYLAGSPNFNTYIYKIHNTGNSPVTSISIGIPGQDTSGSNGQDANGTLWKVLAGSVTLTVEGAGGANGCTLGAIKNPATGLDMTGALTIACPAGPNGLQSGQTLDVQFNAVAPLKINSTYNFPATINGIGTAAAPNWFADTEILVALSANVSVVVNGAATCPAGVVLAPATSTLNFGTVAANTTVTCPDAMIVTVTTDASSPASWAMYVSTDANPPRTGAGTTNELNIRTDSANSTPLAAIACPKSASPSGAGPCFSYDNTAAFVPLGLTSSGTGTRLSFTSPGGTGVLATPIKTLVDYQISIGSEIVPATGHQQTITYTWIAN